MKKKSAGMISRAVLFSILLSFSKSLFAETPPQAAPADLLARFETLEARIGELQNQLVEQSKKHENEIAELRRQIEIKGPAEEAAYIAPPAPVLPKWIDGLGMGGDLRLRYEAFDQNEATRDRNRFRYRLRWKITKEFTKDVELGFRFASGSNTDPTSTNQTFTGDFTYKNIFIDQAYVKYRPSFLKDFIPFLEKTEIAGGKVENPFLEASGGLLWDSDVMPEGFYESLEFGFFNGKAKPFVHLGQFILQENSTRADAELYGVQTGIRWTPPGFGEISDVKLTHAFGYYDFSDYARDSNFIVNGTSLAGGNTVASPTTLAAGDFDILQIYNDLKFKVHGFPAKFFGDFFTNLADSTRDPNDRDIGYQYGLKLGEAKKQREWEALYYYGYIEPNAAVGAFIDSDFGKGFANKRGSAFKLGYRLTDSMKLGLGVYFVNNVTGADDETRRFQTDLEWTF